MTQATALQILQSGANIFLTGEPGSGKTFLINQYIAYLRTHEIHPAVTASTGIAATHINGRTIHSWSGIGIKKSLASRDLEHLESNERLVKRVTTTSVLIIDEVSMLDAATLDAVEQVCRTLRHSTAPFGGLQVILVGDFFQLPPISQVGEEAAQFAFAAGCWPEALFEVCYLTEQHRQSDAALVQVLGDIRTGQVSDASVAHLKTRQVAHHDSATVPTKLFAHNLNVDQVNAEKLAGLKSEAHVFELTSQGSKAQVETLIHSCLSPQRLELKIGAAVMCTKNNPELGFANGTLGTVEDFDRDSGNPIIKTRSGQSITVEPMDWNIEDGGKILATITQLPLRLAWAITIHKSQGMSLDAAVMDLSRAFAFGQGYVALSRVRTLAGLHILGWNERALLIDPAIQEQDHTMREASDRLEKTWQAKSTREQLKLQGDFIRDCGGIMQPKMSAKEYGAVKKSSPYASQNDKLINIRKKYPLAYTPWDDESDQLLRDSYTGETSIKKISNLLQRQPGAIRSRLKHLGLTG